MNEDNLHQIQKRIRSPRSAALAGILFSGLMVASMLLLANTTTLSPRLGRSCCAPFLGFATSKRIHLTYRSLKSNFTERSLH
jgi:hypothetical protein